MPSLLVILIVLPAAAAAMLLLLDAKAPPVRARWAALLATLATFLVSLGVASQFLSINRSGIEGTSPVHAQMEQKYTWMTIVPETADVPPITLQFHLGLDGISLAMVLLTTLLTISAVLVSWTADP